MSHEQEYRAESNDAALALFLQDNDADKLTDILVAALHDALRVLVEEVAGETFH